MVSWMRGFAVWFGQSFMVIVGVLFIIMINGDGGHTYSPTITAIAVLGGSFIVTALMFLDILPALKGEDSTKWIFGLRFSSGFKYAFA